jgi:hypothetical protein
MASIITRMPQATRRIVASFLEAKIAPLVFYSDAIKHVCTVKDNIVRIEMQRMLCQNPDERLCTKRNWERCAETILEIPAAHFPVYLLAKARAKKYGDLEHGELPVLCVTFEDARVEWYIHCDAKIDEVVHGPCALFGKISVKRLKPEADFEVPPCVGESHHLSDEASEDDEDE